jgi:SAM-dependent methyltransferase
MKQYLDIQKGFWNVDEHTARFGRIDTVSRSEEDYERLADRDFGLVLIGIRIQPTWTCLEIGCGVGRILQRLVQGVAPSKVIGVDISENMIRYARRSLPDGPNSKIELHVNSGADLRMVESASVDFAYSNDVFIHIADSDVVLAYLSEAYRVLKVGGLFRFNVKRLVLRRMFSNSLGGLVAKASYATRLRSPIGRYTPGQEGFSGHHYRKSDLHKLLRRSGLCTAVISEFDSIGEGKLWCTCQKL